MPNDLKSDRLRDYFEQCLRDAPPVAPINLISDSQTQRTLEEAFSRFEAPNIIDYGCGRLRFLNALIEGKPNSSWLYTGVDTVLPIDRYPEETKTCEKASASRGQWNLMKLEDFRRSNLQADVCVCMNVLHELPILDLAAAIEDFRQHLKPEGLLFLVDTEFLPEGEPRFVPMFRWDMETIFHSSEDLSYTSRSGIPILFTIIRQKAVPTYHGLPKLLREWFVAKRDAFATAAAEVRNATMKNFRAGLGLGNDVIFDYLYINTIVANACIRVSEMQLDLQCSREEFNSCGWELLEYVAQGFLDYAHHRYPTLNDVYKTLGKRYSYFVIHAVLNGMTPRVLFLEPKSGELAPTELFDDLWSLKLEHKAEGNLMEALNQVYQDFLEKFDPLGQ
jgi:2-polyprenyl-3-methyl-5-hydroxy-6-metoxy-1,4-benzoquinol methylase